MADPSGPGDGGGDGARGVDGRGGPGAPGRADAAEAPDRAATADLPRRVVLVGFMAAGKTSAGRALARRTGYRFVDLDAEVERRAGRAVPEIFREEGEAGFRRLEAEVTRALDPEPGAGSAERPDEGARGPAAARDAAAGGEGLVVATGGGWMARPELRDRWPDAVRVWLEVSPEEALRRLRGDLASRPMVDPDEPLASLRETLERRRDDYARAEHAVRTGGRTPEEVAGRILEALRGA